MMLQDYSAMEENLSTAKSTESIGAILPALMLLLAEAKQLLFPNNRYEPLRWLQFRRIWKLAKLTIRFVNTLLSIFGRGNKTKPKNPIDFK